MKLILRLKILLLILLPACNSNTNINKYENWTEEQKRTYFNQNILSLSRREHNKQFGIKHFDTFYAKMYPYRDQKEELKWTYYLFDEIPYRKKVFFSDSNDFIRITCITGILCYMNLSKMYTESGQHKTVAKRVNFCGELQNQLEYEHYKVHPFLPLDSMLEELDNLGFWELDVDTTCFNGNDGTTYFIEAKYGNDFNRVRRWEPQDCGDSTTQKLYLIAKDIFEYSSLYKSLSYQIRP